MGRLLLTIFNFFFWLPVSVGNHTNYSGGHSTHTTTHSYSGGSHVYSGGGSGGSSGSFTFGGIISTIVVVGIIIVVYILIKKSKINLSDLTGNNQNNQQPYNAGAFDRRDAILPQIKEHDPNFSCENFLSWSEQVFCQLQQAWTERDWKKARPFESEELFNLHKSQLDEYLRNGTINVMENVCVNESFLCDYLVENNTEYLTVYMKTRYSDYIIKEDTKEVIKGDPKTTYCVDYKAKFKRTIGVQTGNLSNKSTHNCPNCGAPVDVNAAGQCAYCGTVITDGTHDWVLCNLDDCGQTEC